MATPLPPVGYTQVTLGGTIYNVPNTGTSPVWSAQLNEYLLALGEQVNGLAGPFDVLNRLAIYSSAPTGLTDFSNVTIDPTVVNGAIVTYSMRYTTSSVTAVELGQAYVVYDPNNAASSKFNIAKQSAGSAGFNLYVTDIGQVQVILDGAPAGTGFNMRLRMSVKAFEL